MAAFQRDPTGTQAWRILLFNAVDESAAGANLTAASHCVFVHPFLTKEQHDFDAYETQAVGRVWRFGQARHVHVHRLVVRQTVDEQILDPRQPGAMP